MTPSAGESGEGFVFAAHQVVNDKLSFVNEWGEVVVPLVPRPAGCVVGEGADHKRGRVGGQGGVLGGTQHLITGCLRS